MHDASKRILTVCLLAFPLLLVLLGVVADRIDLPPAAPDATAEPPGALPSTTAVDPAEVETGLPLMSLWVDRDDLYDPVTGILANTYGRGREWERPGFVSYFDDATLRFATRVGVRVHGDTSRNRQDAQSYRLYFRDQLGVDRFEPGVLFDGAADPIRRLVVHNDRRRYLGGQHLVNPLAYAVAKRTGAIVPLTEPVRFFLNGEWQGVYVLTEYFGVEISNNPDYFTVHFGHDNIWGPYDLRTKMFDPGDTRIPNAQLTEWVFELDRPVTIRQVSERIDVENLTRWFLSVLFCGTGDAVQLPGQFYDSSKQTANWFWINWDMDQSFQDWSVDPFYVLLESKLPGGGLGERPRADWDPRPLALSSLLADDEEYREYFKHAFARMLNHQITPDFLDEQFDYYADIARSYGVEDLGYLEPVREFLTRRPDALWTFAAERLNTREAFRCTIVPPAGGLLIDGVHVTGRFEGRYFPNMVVEMSLPDGTEDTFSQWVVNGQRVEGTGRRLQLRIESDLTIEVRDS